MGALIYGVCLALALVAAVVWPDEPYVWVAMGMFLIRLVDAVWPKERDK